MKKTVDLGELLRLQFL